MVEMDLHRPTPLKIFLNKIRLREIEPWDIGNHYKMIEKYPEMGGDKNQGMGNCGNCPDYRGDWNWWRRFLLEHGV